MLALQWVGLIRGRSASERRPKVKQSNILPWRQIRLVKRRKAHVRFTKPNAQQCLILDLLLRISESAATSGVTEQYGHGTGRQTVLI